MEQRQVAICPYCKSDDTAPVKRNPSRMVCHECGEAFDANEADYVERFKPMKLFLSYGHPEAEIVQRIKAALAERGHEVWIDSSEIKAGNDWREKIAEGVRSSNGVIACLSRHSVRNPGVCLDELAIAVGIHGGNVKTVLLGSEEEIEPPASVTHIQWIDMHDWQERLSCGSEAFDGWFDARMRELFEAIENDENVSFVRDMGGIHDALQPRLDDSKQRELLARGFIGREWLTEMVADWLDDRESPRVCLLTGSPGVGKSAFAAHFAHYGAHLRSSVAASLFCEANRPFYNDAHRVIRTLAYLLACRIPEYRAEITGRIKGRCDLYEMNTDEIFSFLLADPLTRSIDGGHECLCIIIDGVDEAGNSGKNALADVFGRYADRLPAWLKVLVVSRRISAVTVPLSSGARYIDIDDAPELNDEDVRAYLSNVLNPRFADDSRLNDAINAIVDVSEGTMLYASVIADALVKGRAKLDEAITSLPIGLSGSFYQWFRWTFQDHDEYKRDFRGALGCILAAPGGALPENELYRVFGWDRDQIRDFERRLEVFLRRCESPLGGPALSISHAFLAEWLDSVRAGEFQVSAEGAIEKLARTYYDAMENDPNNLTDYETAHLLNLLSQIDSNAYKAARNSNELLDRIISLCKSLEERGLITLAEDIARRELSRFQEASNLPKQALAKIMCCEANLLSNLRKYSEVEHLHRETLAIFRELENEEPGKYLSDIADSCNNLGNVLFDLNQYRKAEELYYEAYSINRMLVDTDSGYWLEVAESSNNLAICYTKLRRFDEAIRAFNSALSIARMLAELSSLEYILSRYFQFCGNLANCYDEAGKYEEAILHHRESIEVIQKLAEDKPGIYEPLLYRALSNFANVLQQNNRFDEAEMLYDQALDKFSELTMYEQEAFLPDAARVRQNLAVLLSKTERSKDSETQFCKAIADYRNLAELEPRTYLPELAMAKSGLAELIHDMGRYTEGERLFRDALSIQRKLADIEPESFLPCVAKTTSNLAALLQDAGKSEEVECLLQETIDILEKLVQYNQAQYQHDLELANDNLAEFQKNKKEEQK